MQTASRPRKAVIGLYSDKLVLSVQEENYCIFRKQIEEDFQDAQSKTNILLLAEKIKELTAVCDKLYCQKVVCLGYGLLRYEPLLKEQLQREILPEVCAVSGTRQAQVVQNKMLSQGKAGVTAGVYGGDLSSQIFFRRQGQAQLESYPVGWRTLCQDGRVIADRVAEEQMRQKLLFILNNRNGIKPESQEMILAAGFDEAAKFVLIATGEGQKEWDDLVIETESLKALLRMMRTSSLRWLPVLEQVSPMFPQKIFCQLVMLDGMMQFMNTKKVCLKNIWMEDGILDDGNRAFSRLK